MAAPTTGWKPEVGVRGALVLAAALALLLDQLTKGAAVRLLLAGPIDPPGPFRFRLVANRGVLMGIQVPPVAMFVATIAIAAFVIWRGSRSTGTREAVGYGLVLGGGLSNLLDRLLARSDFPPGAVVDWISSPFTPVFNLADAFIVVGVVLIVNAEVQPESSA
jgi:signal peptidase II